MFLSTVPQSFCLVTFPLIRTEGPLPIVFFAGAFALSFFKSNFLNTTPGPKSLYCSKSVFNNGVMLFENVNFMLKVGYKLIA